MIIVSPTPGRVSLLVKSNQHVSKGQSLASISVMKIASPIVAPMDAIVIAIKFKDGDIVQAKTPLFVLKEEKKIENKESQTKV